MNKEDYALDFSKAINYSNIETMKSLHEKHNDIYVYLIKLTNDCLKEAGVSYWIENGTLLGAYRNGKVIPHDHDIDFVIIGSEEDFARVGKVFQERVNKPYKYYAKDNGVSKQHKIIHEDLRLDQMLCCKEDPDLYLASVDVYLFDENKEEGFFHHTCWSTASGFATLKLYTKFLSR